MGVSLRFWSSQAVHEQQHHTEGLHHLSQALSKHLAVLPLPVSLLSVPGWGGWFSQEGLSGPRHTLPRKPWGAEDALCLHWSSTCKLHLSCRAGWALLQGGQVFSCPNVGCLVSHKILRVGHSHSCILSTHFFLPLVSVPRHNTAWALLLIHCGIILPLEYQTTKTAYRKSWQSYSHLSKHSHSSVR